MNVPDLQIVIREPGREVNDSPFGAMVFPALSQSPCGGKLSIEWGRTSFASISEIVAVTQYAVHARELGYAVDDANAFSNAASYAARMNYFSLSGRTVPEWFSRHSPGAQFVPMERIVDPWDPGEVATKVVDVVRAHVRHASESAIANMNISLSEVMDNVLTHSRSVEGGIAGAQFHGILGYVEFCVADSGQGIAASMARNPRYSCLSHEEQVEMAFREGYGEYIGRTDLASDEAGAGRGLSIAAGVTRALGGALWAISRDVAVCIGQDGMKRIDGLSYPGTVVSVRLPMEGAGNVLGSEILSGWDDRPVYWDISEGGFYQEGDADDPLW